MKNTFTKYIIILFSITIGTINLFTQPIKSNKSFLIDNNYNSKPVFTIKSTDGTNIDNSIFTNKKFVKQTKVELDSVDYTLKVWENTGGDVIMTLKLRDKNQNVKISVWNMLGKSILDDFDGNYKDLEDNHTIKNSYQLSRGAYVLRIQSDKLKIDSKFIKSK